MTTNKNPSEYGEYSDQYIRGASEKLDEYGVWVKTPPQSFDETQNTPVQATTPPVSSAPLAGAPALEKEAGAVAGAISVEESESESSMFPSELLSGFDKDIEGLNATALSPQDTESVPSLIEETEETKPAETPEVPENNDTSDFDMPDITLFSTDADMPDMCPLENTEPVQANKTDAPIAPETETPHEDKINMELLTRVIDELSLIRGELAGIRQELNLVNERAASARAAEPSVSPSEPPVEPVDLLPASGFPWDEAEPQLSSNNDDFFDDEDEKIVLTGDELTNIFNTANLIPKDNIESPQEIPSFQETPSEKMPSSQRIPTLQETLDELDADLAFAIPAVDTHSTELNQLLEEGIKPMTEPPLDTSYLEESPLYTAVDDVESSLDLSEAVIEEPELSGDIEEHPLEEPSIESIESIENLEGIQEISLEDFPEQEDEEESPDAGNLIDDLLIENGSIKDFPIELDMEQEEDEDSFDFDNEETPKDDGTALEVPFMAEDWEGSVESIITDADLDLEPPLEEPVDFTVEPAAKPEILPIESEISEPYREEIKIEEIPSAAPAQTPLSNVTNYLTQELKHVLSYMDQILESLPDDKIEAFTRSQHFGTYKQVFTTLGLT